MDDDAVERVISRSHKDCGGQEGVDRVVGLERSSFEGWGVRGRGVMSKESTGVFL